MIESIPVFFLILPILFYFNHLHIFGFYSLFYVEYLSNSNPEAGDVESSRGLLWFINYKVTCKIGQHWAKPLFICPPCMASVHSSYIYWGAALLVGYEPYMIPLYLFYSISLSGFNLLKIKNLPS